MSQDLIAKGKLCIQTARDAYNSITAGSDAATTPIVQQLEALQENGNFLTQNAKQRMIALNEEENDLQQKMASIQQEKQHFLKIVDQLKQSKDNVEKELEQLEIKVATSEKDLMQAQKVVQDAEGALSSAQHRARRKKRRGKLLGGVVGGLVAGPIGVVVGAAGGGAISHEQAKGRVDAAKSTLSRRRNERDSAKRSLDTTRDKLPPILQQITEYEAKIEENEVISGQKHEEIGAVKKSIVFVKESVNFWEDFLLAAQYAENRTERLKSIVQKAEEMVNLTILKADGTIMVAISFVDAWEALVTHGKVM